MRTMLFTALLLCSPLCASAQNQPSANSDWVARSNSFAKILLGAQA